VVAICLFVFLFFERGGESLQIAQRRGALRFSTDSVDLEAETTPNGMKDLDHGEIWRLVHRSSALYGIGATWCYLGGLGVGHHGELREDQISVGGDGRAGGDIRTRRYIYMERAKDRPLSLSAGYRWVLCGLFGIIG